MKDEITYCHECNRGGNGNDTAKCACGWNRTEKTHLGCFLGSPIVGKIKPKIKISRGKARYKRYLQFCDCFDSFIDFCRWDQANSKKVEPMGISQ
jgi:hypothetical protein